MINNAGDFVPFSCHFAQPLPELNATLPARYSPERDVSQVLVNGTWIDAVDHRDNMVSSTRETRMHQETTDDN